MPCFGATHSLNNARATSNARAPAGTMAHVENACLDRNLSGESVWNTSAVRLEPFCGPRASLEPV
eukprot:11225014-Lingulodinium_polyedra.AAC.1